MFEHVEVVLCDADGNLFPSEEPAFVAAVQVTNRFLAEHGVRRQYGSEELRLAATGMSFRATLVALALEHEIPVAPQLVRAGDRSPAPVGGAAPALTPEVLEDWVRVEKQATTDYLQTALSPDPDVLQPLTELAARYGVAAVSSSADARIAACFRVTGMADFFPPSRRFSAEDSLPVPTSKPDPAIYLFAAEALGHGPGQCLAVEDSVAGATSAVAAGIPTIGNLQFVQPGERAGRQAALEQVGVSAVVESWRGVLDLLPPASS